MKFTIQKILPSHDAAICAVIKTVGTEYGAIGEGFGPSDPEVQAMSQHYKDEGASRYLVATMGNLVVGGSGIAPFNGSGNICELKKLFILPEARGFGIGKKLLEESLSYAKVKGYTQCYLDTLVSMTAAIAMYEKFGFEHLDSPLEGTIHNRCDVWMLKTL